VTASGEVGPRGRSRGEAHSRVRSAVRSIVERTGCGLGLLLEEGGVVSAAAGNPGSMDPVTFAVLASAHVQAARALAPLAVGTELSRLAQEGRRSRIALVPVGGDRVLALLSSHDIEGGLPAPERGPDVSELDQALAALHAWGGGVRREGVGVTWVEAAESQIDQVFREGRVPPCP
jgi:hypothetical protein